MDVYGNYFHFVDVFSHDYGWERVGNGTSFYKFITYGNISVNNISTFLQHVQYTQVEVTINHEYFYLRSLPSHYQLRYLSLSLPPAEIAIVVLQLGGYPPMAIDYTISQLRGKVKIRSFEYYGTHQVVTLTITLTTLILINILYPVYRYN